MSEPTFRYRRLDQDFRRDPKTACYCALCQKDIKAEPRFYAHMIDGRSPTAGSPSARISDLSQVAFQRFGKLNIAASSVFS
jgi:hypothetical protein